MTTAHQESQTKYRCLRVGVLFAGHLIEERVQEQGEDVTIGHGARCTFIVPPEGWPRSWRLFRWRHDRCAMRRLPTMGGKMASGKSVVGLPEGGTTSLPQAARGKVQNGDWTILFQMVTRPSLAKPRLPASLRPSLFAVVDRQWMMVLVLSFMAHLGSVIQLRRIDWPRSVGYLDDDTNRVFHHWPIPRQPPVLPIGKAVVGQAPHAPPPRLATAPKVVPRTTGAEVRATLVDDVRKVGLLAVLTAKGAGAGGVIADLLSDGGVERSQEQALAGVNAVRLASADSQLTVRAGQGNGKILDVHGIGQVGIGIAAAETGHREERRVVQIHTEMPSIDSGASGRLDGAQLAREIRVRLGALRACYERSLKRHPDLGGKLLMRLTITPAGTVASVDLSGDAMDDADMLACVRGSVMHWRFPAPENGSVEASFPLVFQAAN